MPDMFADQPHVFTIHQMHACALREVAQRNSVYPRLIADGKMSQKKADHELAAMKAIVDHFFKLMDDGK